MKSNRNVVIEISHSSAVKAVCLIIFLDGPGTWQRTSGHAKAIPIVAASDLPAGTAGTGRIHPRQAAGRAGTDTGRRIFFLSKPYLCPSRVHGYQRYGYGGTQTHWSAGRERDRSAGQTL
jgi:hypothetical protein